MMIICQFWYHFYTVVNILLKDNLRRIGLSLKIGITSKALILKKCIYIYIYIYVSEHITYLRVYDGSWMMGSEWEPVL
jgi:hypothetical protein